MWYFLRRWRRHKGFECAGGIFFYKREVWLSLRDRVRASLRPSEWRIGWKVAAVLWGVAFLPALGALAYLYEQARAEQSAMQLEVLQDAAARIANQLTQLITDTGRMNAFVSLAPELVTLLADGPRKRGQTEKVLAMLHRVVVRNRDVELILVMNRDGTTVTSTDPDMIGRNFAFREYFKLAIQGRPHITGFVVGSVLGNIGVYFSHPVTTRDGQVVGVLVTKLVSKAFVDVIEAERKSRTQTAFLLDAEGVVIYHPDPNWVFHSIVPLSEKDQAAILVDRRFRIPKVESLNIPSLRETVTRYRTAGSVRWLSPKTNQYERAGYMQVPGVDWTVIVSADERYLALAQLRLERIMTAGGAVVALAFCVAYWLLRRLTVKPLTWLSGAARRIVRGDYRIATLPGTTGELRNIRDALDAAAEKLLQHEREQEITGRILMPEIRQRLLSGHPDSHDIARMAVVYCAILGIGETLERRSGADALATLGDYSEHISDIVKPWGGHVNSASGHAVIAVLAAPLSDNRLESRAVSAALAVRRRVAELTRTRAEANEPTVEIAIGVSTAGILVTGAMSAHERYLNAMLNDGINVSSTLAALSLRAPDHPVMIDQTTYLGVRSRTDIAPTSRGQQKLRGRAELSEVYSIVFDVQPPLTPAAVVSIARQERSDAGQTG
jgi:class 3 adenylate cyclase